MIVIIRNVCLALAVIALLAAGAVFYLARKPFFYRWLATAALEENFDAVQVEIKEVKADFPSSLAFGGITLELKKGSEAYRLAAGRTAAAFKWRKRAWQGAIIEARDVDLQGAGVRFDGGKVYLDAVAGDAGLASAAGAVSFKKIEAYGYGCSSARGDVRGSFAAPGKEELVIDNLDLLCYGGSVRGKVKSIGLKDIAYNVVLKITGIDLDELGRDVQGIKGQVKGRLTGDVILSGEIGAAPVIKAAFAADHGGAVKAALLQYLTQYLPANSAQHKELAKRIAEDSMVALDSAALTLNSVSDKQAEVNFDLYSKELNLKPNVTVSVNMDTELHRLPEIFHNNTSRR